jgi:hypothetical protein
MRAILTPDIKEVPIIIRRKLQLGAAYDNSKEKDDAAIL